MTLKMAVFCLICLLCGAGYGSPVQSALDKLDSDSKAKISEMLAKAGQEGLPVLYLERKIQEGISKGISGPGIYLAVSKRFQNLKLNKQRDGGSVEGLFKLEAQPENPAEQERKSFKYGAVPKTPKKKNEKVMVNRKPRKVGPEKTGPKPAEHKPRKQGNTLKKDDVLDKKEGLQNRKLERIQKKMEKKLQKLERKTEKKLKK